MFTERFDELFQAVGIKTNSEFARIMGSESAYISMLRKGKRTPAPGSQSAGRLARAFYDAAAEAGRTEELCGTCGVPADAEQDLLAKGVERWLLEAETPSQPEARRRGRSPRYANGEAIRLSRRLDAAMLLVGLSNAQLARISGVDASLICRYRQGDRFPGAQFVHRVQRPHEQYRAVRAPHAVIGTKGTI